MSVCPHRSPSGYGCTLGYGHKELQHQATTLMGRREVILDTWTDEELRDFHRPTLKTEIPLQIRRSGTWRAPFPGEIQQVLQEGHQVTIRKVPA